MAIQSLTNVAWWPPLQDESQTAIGPGTTFQINASGELAAIVGQWPRTGNIDRVGIVIVTVGTAPVNGTQVSLQDVDLSTGLPDGTPDQSATIAAGSMIVGHHEVTLGSSRAVTRGGIGAAVITIPSFTAGDNISVGYNTLCTSSLFPHGVRITNTKDQTSLPYIWLRYDDGVYASFHQELWAVTAFNGLVLETDRTPDEAGTRFSHASPFTFSKVAIQLYVTAATTYDVVVYDNASSVIATLTLDSDLNSATAAYRYLYGVFPSDISYPGGDVAWRVVVKPSSATLQNRLGQWDLPSLAHFDTIAGQSVFATGRTDAGSWVDYNNGTDGYRFAKVHLGINGFDDATGGGSGGGAHIFGGTVIR
jgi:hypothetical protein